MSNTQALLSFERRPTQGQIQAWWPSLTPINSVTRDDWPSVMEWAQKNDGTLGGPPGQAVKALFHCGSRWVLADFSMTMCDDDESLARASLETGPVYLATTQGTAGFAGFRAFKQGVLVRDLSYCDGAVTAQGGPIAEEEGMDIKNLYRDINRLWMELGHTGLLFNCEPKDVECMMFRDADEASLGESLDDPAPPAPIATKPWWKLW